MTVLIDDHLLRDWLVGRDDGVTAAIGEGDIATTNLWYARLCKTVARSVDAPTLRRLSRPLRERLVEGLIELPADVQMVPLRDLAWRVGTLVARHRGLSTLGAEAIAAAGALDARLLVSSRDDGPGIRAAAVAEGIGYRTLAR